MRISLNRSTLPAFVGAAALAAGLSLPLGAQGTPPAAPGAPPTPAAPAAPGAVTPDQAKAFLGDWNVATESPQGAVTFALSLKNADGKLAAEISSEMTPRQPITDIAKSGESLLLRYMLDFQGNAVPVALTLTLDGEKLNVAFDFAAGAFQMNGVGTKKK